ncbi:unnamed protein product [Dimorphilus gyrociliatus]|uniref:Thyroglobulin type-1 domain-containing protein n=1 Tax=Dimorphilus gyrociliatus TaxID=2664684 RepID=A0A7I8W505_9ANNE|nr:unnamed protein product [Dimorphilus gyrociliatus]
MSVNSKCVQARKSAQDKRKRNQKVHVPECVENGRYAPKQCFMSYCWCVTPKGEIIPKTSSKRRSSCNKNENKRKRSECPVKKRIRFNKQLMRRLKLQEGVQSKSLAFDLKFKRLDLNRDNKLMKKEFRRFVSSIRKLVRPRICSRTMFAYCDANADRRVVKSEWRNCLDPSRARSLFLLNKKKKHSFAILLTTKNSKDLSSKKTTNCSKDRTNAIKEHNLYPPANVFIPDCEGDMFSTIQCHNSTGYCWCAYRTTGLAVPRTVRKGRPENCKIKMALENCTSADLNEYLSKIITKANRTVSDVKNTSTFLQLHKQADLNNNNKIDKREWRVLRKLIKIGKKRLRDCRRNFLIFCDDDNNKEITLEEWLACTRLTNEYMKLPGSF